MSVESADIASSLVRRLRKEGVAACRIPVVVEDERWDVRATPVPVVGDQTEGTTEAAELMRTELMATMMRYPDVSFWTTLGVLQILEHDLVEMRENK